MKIESTCLTLYFIFNAAQPGVGRVQVLGSKKFQTEEEEEEEEEEQLLVFA